MDVDGELQVTNSFPFPTMEAPVQDDKHDKHDSASGAGAAPRAKANTYYQAEMVRCLREMNVDANSVGWYQSASLGNFVSSQRGKLDIKYGPEKLMDFVFRYSSTPTSSRTSAFTNLTSMNGLLPWFMTLHALPLVRCHSGPSVSLLSLWLRIKRANSPLSLCRSTT